MPNLTHKHPSLRHISIQTCASIALALLITGQPGFALSQESTPQGNGAATASKPAGSPSAEAGVQQSASPETKAADAKPNQTGTTQPDTTKNASAANNAPAAPPKPQLVQTELLNQEFAKTWKLVAAEEGVRTTDVWQMNKTDSGRVLVCTGKPKGYLRTQKEHTDYELAFEFRYPMDENGNSGVLVHIDGKDKVWPDGIQVQLHRPTAGSIFPSGNRKARFTVGAKLDLNSKTWNKCKITVLKGTIEVSINGVDVGPMRYCNPAKGFFAFQSEGSEVHFRNMVLTEEVVPTKPATAPTVVQQTPTTGTAAAPAAVEKPEIPAKPEPTKTQPKATKSKSSDG